MYAPFSPLTLLRRDFRLRFFKASLALGAAPNMSNSSAEKVRSRSVRSFAHACLRPGRRAHSRRRRELDNHPHHPRQSADAQPVPFDRTESMAEEMCVGRPKGEELSRSLHRLRLSIRSDKSKTPPPSQLQRTSQLDAREGKEQASRSGRV